MTYPDALIERLGGVAAFAALASDHPQAPTSMNGDRRSLDPSAVYMWKRRGRVPFMWQAVVSALEANAEAA